MPDVAKDKDPAILFVKPGAISDGDIAVLAGIGVTVIQCEHPSEIKFTRPSLEVSGDALLTAALDILNDRQICGDAARNALMRAVTAAVKTSIG